MFTVDKSSGDSAFCQKSVRAKKSENPEAVFTTSGFLTTSLAAVTSNNKLMYY
ncbi:hypothetical protein [Candidatus Uabimicrobium sp. HlEnr_7]|uniref:hypothetical protein n=1 Tax=Candidatus Uabimicrobium helgolandensis TaxID=3095367 RepID=UPI00355662B5